MSARYVVIMAGGKGERFWPQSRLRRPKHLLPIVGEAPMLTQAVDRLDGLVPPSRVFILTNAEQVEGVRAACPQVPAENIVAEPVGRDTAPAVGLAALLVAERDRGAAFAMLPADHVIHDASGFRAVAEAAFAAAEAEPVLVTIGIRPDHPATGYGYIQRGAELSRQGEHAVFDVEQFREKPDLETAQGYVDSGHYLWNAGMFFWQVEAITTALKAHAPELSAGLDGIREARAAGHTLEAALERRYGELPKISIDYAVMEKADAVRVVPSAFDWDDVGAWPAVARHYPADAAGNVARGQAVFEASGNNIVFTEGGHLVGLVGVDDLIVVQTGDATLVCARDQAQKVKQLVQQLQQHPEGRERL